MSPFWPFKKKKPKSRLRKNDYTENIVEYERNISTKKDSKKDDNSHLKNKNFLNALKILDQSKE
tara:strand:+ start:2623 stop:2814 length:192 start_codon:yes stop_codon:yes gene_type:complete